MLALETVTKFVGLKGNVTWVLVGVLALFVLSLYGLGSILHRGKTFAELLSPGLWGIVGRMGAGKTYFMTWCVRRQVRLNRRLKPYPGPELFRLGLHKRPLYANYEVKGAERVKSWEDVLACPAGSLIALDEGHLWWASDDWNVEAERLAWCSQLRKKRLSVLWTAQDWSFVAKRLRALTFGVWEGGPFLGGHRYVLYNPGGFRQDSGSRSKRMARMWVRRSKRVMRAYNTLELVVPLPKATLGGLVLDEDGRPMAGPAGPGARGTRVRAGTLRSVQSVGGEQGA